MPCPLDAALWKEPLCLKKQIENNKCICTFNQFIYITQCPKSMHLELKDKKLSLFTGWCGGTDPLIVTLVRIKVNFPVQVRRL
jgi:hypothetical protein